MNKSKKEQTRINRIGQEQTRLDKIRQNQTKLDKNGQKFQRISTMDECKHEKTCKGLNHCKLGINTGEEEYKDVEARHGVHGLKK